MCIRMKLVATRGKEWTKLEPQMFPLSMESIDRILLYIVYFTVILEAIMSRKEGGSVFPISQTLMKQQISTSYAIGFFMM